MNALILCAALLGPCDGCDACVVGETAEVVAKQPACHVAPVRHAVKFFATHKPVRRAVVRVVKAHPVRKAVRFVLPPYRRCCS